MTKSMIVDGRGSTNLHNNSQISCESILNNFVLTLTKVSYKVFDIYRWTVVGNGWYR